MFTGLIQRKGKIEKISKNNAGLEIGVSIALSYDWPLVIGESIAINGACMTATTVIQSQSENDSQYFTVEISPESLQKTTLGELKSGETVNLERALRLSDPLGGHLVSGHVDTQGKPSAMVQEGEFWRYEFSYPEEFQKYLIPKGSIAINGISLTVNELADGKSPKFSVMLIPHTLSETTLGAMDVGASVNLEFDLVGKFILRAQKIEGSKPMKLGDVQALGIGGSLNG